MSKGAKINAFLLSIGASAEFAYTEAHRLEIALAVNDKVRKPATRKGGVGLSASESLSDRIVGYAHKRKGNVWNLSTLALALGADKNSLSAQITHLVKKGVLTRTGRAEYCRA